MIIIIKAAPSNPKILFLTSINSVIANIKPINPIIASTAAEIAVITFARGSFDITSPPYMIIN